MELVETLTATDWETERAQLVRERDEARNALNDFEEAAAIALQRQIESAVGKIRLELADTEEAAGIALERQVAAAVERIRIEQGAECESLRAECLKLTADLNEANQYLAEMKEAYRRELSEHKATDEERKRLVQELREVNEAKEAKALLAEDPAAAVDAIRMETARIEALMQELSDTIDNAETELSEVIRKTFERSQQEAYIKGLLFSANLPS